jgi:dsDNA-specific endonuclease/ATPase MutS2
LSSSSSSSSPPLRVGVRVGAGGPSCSAAATESTSSYREKSLVTIEWPQLCQYVAGFAATSLGQRELCTNLHPPETERAALAMIRQTRAIQLMQEEYVAEIDFGGIQTLEAELALKRVTRGGMLNGGELLAVASLIRGSQRVARKIRECASQAEKEGNEAMVDGLRPISDVFATFDVPFGVATDIVAKLDEDSGSVRESASDDVRRAAGRVRTLENRLRSILKNWGDAIEEQGGRLCVVLGMGVSPPKGSVMVGGRIGGAAVIEPPAAVNINNDLVQARSELKAAEDAVLWVLTKTVERAERDTANAGCLTRCLSAVVWLDGVNAKYRFGDWISGTLVTEFSQFRKTGRARGGKKGGAAGRKMAEAGEGGDDWLVMIRKLRHPLLMARYLLNKGESSGNRPSETGTTAVAPASSQGKRLPGWRKEKSSSDSSDESDSDEDSLPPPVPIDILVERGTKGVVITGPNTGGKTAALKALGLAVSMAKCGIPVPSEAPVRMPCFDAVYADIGDEQSLSASLSTFSGHLRRIEGLREESTGKSLVLLDELGTGTDAIDGAALGIALMNTFARDGPGGSGLTLASTHHSVLTSLKYQGETGVFENASVEFDEVNLQPTYKLIWGVPGRSCALNIAERLDVDADIVQQARSLLGRDATEVDEQLVRLEALRKREEDIRSDIRKLQRAQKRVEGSIVSARCVRLHASSTRPSSPSSVCFCFALDPTIPAPSGALSLSRGTHKYARTTSVDCHRHDSSPRARPRGIQASRPQIRPGERSGNGQGQGQVEADPRARDSVASSELIGPSCRRGVVRRLEGLARPARGRRLDAKVFAECTDTRDLHLWWYGRRVRR